MVARTRGRNLLALMKHLRARGHDPDRVVRHFGLSADLFQTPGLWIPASLADGIWELAAETFGDANLGLRVAENAALADYGVLGYLATYSEDLHAALSRIAKYHRTVSNLTRYQLEVTPNHARFYSRTGLPRTSRQMEELCVGVIVSCARKLCGAGFVLSRASFRSQRPPALGEHHALLCEDLTFEADRTFIEFSPQVLWAPIPSADPQLVQILETTVQGRLSKAMDSELPARVRAHVAGRLAAGQRAPCEAVAAELGLSARSLRRHLSEKGLSFRAIHEEVIAQMADRLLLDPGVSLEEVVQKLQFSNLRGLAGATQRWFGMTPQQYRKRTHLRSI